MRRFVLAILLSMGFLLAAGESDIMWQQTFGSDTDDVFYSVSVWDSTPYYYIGGATMAGGTNYDYWILALDPGNSSPVWEYTFGAGGHEQAYGISNGYAPGYGGFIATTGYTYSYGNGQNDIMSLAMTANGNFLDTMLIGGASYDVGYSVFAGEDGTYVDAGRTHSYSGDGDMIVTKYILADGHIIDTIWSQVFHASDSFDVATSVIRYQDVDIVGGYTKGTGNYDGIILVLSDSTGERIANYEFRGSGNDYIKALTVDRDGNIIGAGYSTTDSHGGDDVWIFKMAPDGTVLWDKKYGGPLGDRANSVFIDSNGNVVIGGYTESYGQGNEDCFILSVNLVDGKPNWYRVYGGSGTDILYGATFGGHDEGVFVGKTSSYGAGSYDGWIITMNLDVTPLRISGFVPRVVPLSSTRKIYVYGSGFSGYDAGEININFVDASGVVQAAVHPDEVISDNELVATVNLSGIPTGSYSVYIDAGGIVTTDTLKGVVYVINQGADEKYLSYVNVGSTGPIGTMASGDADNDGRIELYAGGGYYLGSTLYYPLMKISGSGGGLSVDTIWSIRTGARAIVIGDIDLDGKNEMYIGYGDFSSGTVSRLRWDGTSWTEDTVLNADNVIMGLDAGSIYGQSKRALYAVSYDSTFYEITKAGSGYHKDSITIAGYGTFIDVKLGDLERDGKVKAYVSTASGKILEIKRDSYGNFVYTTISESLIKNIGTMGRLYITDADNNGYEELYASSVVGVYDDIFDLKITYNSGAFVFDTIGREFIDPRTQIIVEDLNGDGKVNLYGTGWNHGFYKEPLEDGMWACGVGSVYNATMEPGQAAGYVDLDGSGNLTIFAGGGGMLYRLVPQNTAPQFKTLEVFKYFPQTAPENKDFKLVVYGRGLNNAQEVRLEGDAGSFSGTVDSRYYPRLVVSFNGMPEGHYNLLVISASSTDTIRDAVCVNRSLYYPDGTAYLKVDTIFSASTFHSLVKADLDNDGVAELYAGSDGKVYKIYRDPVTDTVKVEDIGLTFSHSISALFYGDVDNSGKRKLFYRHGPNMGIIYYDGTYHKTPFQKVPNNISGEFAYNGDIADNINLVDLNGNGFNEIVNLSYNGLLNLLEIYQDSFVLSNTKRLFAQEAAWVGADCGVLIPGDNSMELYVTGADAYSGSYYDARVRKVTYNNDVWQIQNVYTNTGIWYQGRPSILKIIADKYGFDNIFFSDIDDSAVYRLRYGGSGYSQTRMRTTLESELIFDRADIDNDGTVEYWGIGDYLREFMTEGDSFVTLDSLYASGVEGIAGCDLDGDNKLEMYAITSYGKVLKIQKVFKKKLRVRRTDPVIFSRASEDSLITIFGSGFTLFDKDSLKVNLIDKHGNTALVLHPDTVLSYTRLSLHLPVSAINPGWYDIVISYDTIKSDTLKDAVFISGEPLKHYIYRVDTIGRIASSLRWYITKADMDGDGRMEYYVHDDDHIYRITYKYSTHGWEVFTIYTGNLYVSGLVAGDMDHDGKMELYFSPFATTPTPVYCIKMEADTYRVDSISYFSSGARIGIGDADNDGEDELLGYSVHGVLNVLNFRDTTWERKTYTLGYVAATSDIVVADVDNDGLNEIYTYGAPSGQTDAGLIVIKLVPSLSCSYVYQNANITAGGIRIYDTDGDGQEELYTGVYGTDGNTVIYSFKYHGSSYSPYEVMKNGGLAGDIGVGDLDNDGKNEIAAGFYSLLEMLKENNNYKRIITGIDTIVGILPASINDTTRLDMLVTTRSGYLIHISQEPLPIDSAVSVNGLLTSIVPVGDSLITVLYGKNLNNALNIYVQKSQSSYQKEATILEVSSGGNYAKIVIPPLDTAGYYNVIVHGNGDDTLYSGLLVNNIYSETDNGIVEVDTLKDMGGRKHKDTYYYMSITSVDLDKDGKKEVYVAGDSLWTVDYVGDTFVVNSIMDIPGVANCITYGRFMKDTVSLFVGTTSGEIYELSPNDTGFTILKVFDLSMAGLSSSITNGIKIMDVDHDKNNELIAGWGNGMVAILKENNSDIDLYITELHSSSVVKSIDIGDMDRDGTNDVYVNTYGPSAYLNDIHYSDTGYVKSNIFSLGSAADIGKIGDINKDGNSEIAVANYAYLYLGNYSSGSWNLDTVMSSGGSYIFRTAIFTDFKNTGTNDLIVSHSGHRLLRVVSHGADSFEIDTLVSFSDAEPMDMTACDLDKDGEVEVYAVNGSGRIFRIAYVHDTLPPSMVNIVYPQNNTWFTAVPDSFLFIWNRVSKIVNTRMNSIKFTKFTPLDYPDEKGVTPVNYIVEIARDSLFDTITLIDTTSDTVYVIGNNSPVGEENYFRVRAFDLAGNEGPYSEVVRFGIDSIAPVIDSVTILSDTTYEGPFNIVIGAHDVPSGIDSVILFYRRMEDTAWIMTLAVRDTQDVYIATIPEVNLQNDSVKYYISISDYAHLSDTAPAGAPYVYYEFIASGIGETNRITRFEMNVPVVSENTVRFSLTVPEKQRIGLNIYDIQGRKVITVLNRTLLRGKYTFSVANLKRGVYIYHLRYGNRRFNGKFIVVGK